MARQLRSEVIVPTMQPIPASRRKAQLRAHVERTHEIRSLRRLLTKGAMETGTHAVEHVVRQQAAEQVEHGVAVGGLDLMMSADAGGVRISEAKEIFWGEFGGNDDSPTWGEEHAGDAAHGHSPDMAA